LADEFGQCGVVGYEFAVLVERADCVVQVDYEVLCAEHLVVALDRDGLASLEFEHGLDSDLGQDQVHFLSFYYLAL